MARPALGGEAAPRAEICGRVCASTWTPIPLQSQKSTAALTHFATKSTGAGRALAATLANAISKKCRAATMFSSGMRPASAVKGNRRSALMNKPGLDSTLSASGHGRSGLRLVTLSLTASSIFAIAHAAAVAMVSAAEPAESRKSWTDLTVISSKTLFSSSETAARRSLETGVSPTPLGLSAGFPPLLTG